MLRFKFIVVVFALFQQGNVCSQIGYVDVGRLASTATLSPPTYVIPVVFHIFHNGGASNVSNAQVLNQVSILNTEFRRQQADTLLTPPAFKPLAAALSIEFRLATLDPLGNCTNGINRIYTTMYTCANVDSLCKRSAWPPDKYLNIWIAESFRIDNPLANSNGLCVDLGVGTWPWIQFMKQGVVMPAYDINNIGSPNTRGRRMVHEIGHFLNLRHIWGDANCGNDSVADTPPSVTFNTGCPSFPRNPLNACGSSTIGEMYSNYMDYTSEACTNLFTAGQVNRMEACLTSTVGNRNLLWSPSNLSNTGTNDPYVYPGPCPGTPDILPYQPVVICAGDSVKFTDISYGFSGSPVSRIWNFYGNPVSSLTDSIVWVKYSVPGVYNVELTKTLSSDSETRLFIKKVIVLDPTDVLGVPYTNGFETASEANQWKVVNSDNDTTWRVFDNVSANGLRCVGINNYYNNYPLLDEIISPAFDLSAANSSAFQFKVHFSKRLPYNSDRLSLFYTKDCGKTWMQLYSRNGSMLKTVMSDQTMYHLPASFSEWRTETVVFSTDSSFSNIRFRFQFKSDYGNNLLIDDINLTSSDITGSREEERNPGVSAFPNPTDKSIHVRFKVPLKEITGFEVTDVTGRVFLNGFIERNTSEFLMDMGSLPAGMYLLKVNYGCGYITKVVKY